jgi:hypothetical protein
MCGTPVPTSAADESDLFLNLLYTTSPHNVGGTVSRAARSGVARKIGLPPIGDSRWTPGSGDTLGTEAMRTMAAPS